ncbi:MAG: chromate efflux transporter [Deltaproteobacteria bacterium]|nr:chromate efflux transporter [Deltaproteobacteria bacterium]
MTPSTTPGGAPALASQPPEPAGHGIAFGTALKVWLRVALLSFGGPAGQIAVMHRILVEEKRWIGENRFLHALNYCMLLPGPEAQQLATYIGWMLHRTAGGLAAGTLFILPGVLSILGLSILYAGFHQTALVQALFFGIKAAVLAVVVEAVLRIGRRALKTRPLVMIALAAFVGIYVFSLPFPLIVAAAALAGLAGGRFWPEKFQVASHGKPAHSSGAAQDDPALDALLADGGPEHIRPSTRRALSTAALWLTLWLVPLGALALLTGLDSTFTQVGIFFSKLAVVTFGGAYSVLAYMAQEAVNHYGWLAPGEMLDGLGMAETTPGPLIMVVQFVGFMGAFRDPGMLNPYAAGVLASGVAVWVTFTPCFLWIFTGAPYVEWLRGNKALSAALSGITAAVVGVVLNLALWFGLHVVFTRVGEVSGYGARLLVPEWSSLNPGAAVLSAGAMLAMLRFKVGMIPTLAASATLGAGWFLLMR